MAELSLTVEKPAIPIRVIAESEFTISYTVGLTKGAVAENGGVGFFIPDSFSFPTEPGASTENKFYNDLDYICVGFNLGLLFRPQPTTMEVTIKAGSAKGNYTIFYRVGCAGFRGELVPIEVEVV